MKPAALFRNDRGGLEIRHYATPAQAAAVAAGRELPQQETVQEIAGHAKGRISHFVFARKLGIPPKIVRSQFKRGGLPGAVQHSSHWIMVPTSLLRLAEAYGLKQVERMAAAGLIAKEDYA